MGQNQDLSDALSESIKSEAEYLEAKEGTADFRAFLDGIKALEAQMKTDAGKELVSQFTAQLTPFELMITIMETKVKEFETANPVFDKYETEYSTSGTTIYEVLTDGTKTAKVKLSLAKSKMYWKQIEAASLTIKPNTLVSVTRQMEQDIIKSFLPTA